MRAGFRALLVAPLLRREDIVGMLVVRRRTPGAFPQNTVDLIKTFAAQSVLAIQNARLFHEIEDKGRQLEVASQAQIAVPRQYEPRAAHAAQRHSRLHRIDPRQHLRRSAGKDALRAGARADQRQAPARPDQRRARSVEDRSRAARRFRCPIIRSPSWCRASMSPSSRWRRRRISR